MRKLKLNHDKVVGIPKSYWFLLLDLTWGAVKVTKSCRGPQLRAGVFGDKRHCLDLLGVSYCLTHLDGGDCLLPLILNFTQFSFMFNPEMFA